MQTKYSAGEKYIDNVQGKVVDNARQYLSADGNLGLVVEFTDGSILHATIRAGGSHLSVAVEPYPSEEG